MLRVTSERLLADPRFPDRFVATYAKLIGISNERHSKEERLIGKFLQPPLVRKLRVAKTELVKTPRSFVDERGDAELLRESFQFADRRCSFHEVDEVSLDPTLGKKAQGFPGICAFLDTENLNLQFLSLQSWSASLLHALPQGSYDE